MRDQGLETAIVSAGGVRSLARLVGVSQPTISNWSRIPAERVLLIEQLTGVDRTVLRPDLYPAEESPHQDGHMSGVDEIDRLRSQEYALLARLLSSAPDEALLRQLEALTGDASALGMAHLRLAETARRYNADQVGQEFFDLFIGIGRGELLPYGSYYLTGFLHERPLARLREDLVTLGLQRAETVYEPEDHIAILCEVMAGLAGGGFEAEAGAERRFFERHLKPWAARLFADMEVSENAKFYAAVGALGRLFMEIEAQAFAMDA